MHSTWLALGEPAAPRARPTRLEEVKAQRGGHDLHKRDVAQRVAPSLEQVRPHDGGAIHGAHRHLRGAVDGMGASTGLGTGR